MDVSLFYCHHQHRPRSFPLDREARQQFRICTDDRLTVHSKRFGNSRNDKQKSHCRIVNNVMQRVHPIIPTTIRDQ